MDLETQLLCTFVNVDELDNVLLQIQNTYKLVFNKIYVLENINDEKQLVLTYNVEKNVPLHGEAPTSTISVHRKKQTNTIYTINAINRLIEEKNNGVLDKSFKIDWNDLKNMILVTAYGRLKIVNTKLSNIITI
jgi:hypothetical protein